MGLPSVSEIFKPVVEVAGETVRILPDGMILASALFALLTLSLPQAALSGALLESVGLFHVIRSAVRQLHITDTIPQVAASGKTCTTGFVQPTLETFSLLGQASEGAFPSAPLQMLSVAASYVFMTLNAQYDELQALGPEQTSKYYLSVIFLCFFLGVVALIRLRYGCETFGIVFFTIPLGLLIGAGLVWQNQTLFGPSCINLLGIPLLRNRTANGQPLQACTQRVGQ